jgi:hypothetical protein
MSKDIVQVGPLFRGRTSQHSSGRVHSPHFTSRPRANMPRHSAFKGWFGGGIYCRRQRYQRASTRCATKIVLLTRLETSAVGLSTLAATNSITQPYQASTLVKARRWDGERVPNALCGSFFLSFHAYILFKAIQSHFCARSSFNQHRNERGCVGTDTLKRR